MTRMMLAACCEECRAPTAPSGASMVYVPWAARSNCVPSGCKQWLMRLWKGKVKFHEKNHKCRQGNRNEYILNYAFHETSSTVYTSAHSVNCHWNLLLPIGSAVEASRCFPIAVFGKTESRYFPIAALGKTESRCFPIAALGKTACKSPHGSRL